MPELAPEPKSQMQKVFSDPKYRGKHVVVSGGRVYSSATGVGMNKILDKPHKNHPKQTPHIPYVPKPRTVIV